MFGRSRWFRCSGMTALLLASMLAGSTMAAAADGPSPAPTPAGQPSKVSWSKAPDGSYELVVNGHQQTFVGMGYDPIYRYLLAQTREAYYKRDFGVLRDAGVNTILGWDEDKGYEQDKFDELTLNVAYQYGLGVVMPLNLPPWGNYEDEHFVSVLLDQAKAKVTRFKDFPALRMWGVGNEVFTDMDPDMYPAFEQAYLKIADLFHQIDPNHPVIYREAEDVYVPNFASMLRESGDMRPWLLYGMNVYNKNPDPLLDQWPEFKLDRPMLVSEFGAEGDTPEQRANGYEEMWQSIRAHRKYVLGGAPYVWSTEGPEPTDRIWGLTDGTARPVDGTLGLLTADWHPPGTSRS